MSAEFTADEEALMSRPESGKGAMQHIIVPEGLTPEGRHQFWACVEVHAYYERKNCLVRSCGDDTDYSDSHIRKQVVVAFHLSEDAELRSAELQRWLDGGDA